MEPRTKLIFTHADYDSYPASVKELKARYLNYPRNISIETLVKCNARCSFCPYPKSPRKGQVMTNELFYKIVDELTEIPSTHHFGITLARINEPLLDSRLNKFSDIIATKLPSAKQQFWTNGTMLKPGVFEWITQYAHAKLTVSLNSVNEREHTQMMGFRLEGVFQGLDYLHKLVESSRFNIPVALCAPFIHESQASEYEEVCRKRWPLFKSSLRPFFQWMGGDDIGVDYRDANLLPGFDESRVARFPCAQWFDLHILANGYITKCCIDENGRIGEIDFDLHYRHALDIYRESKEYRERLPARSDIRECKGCVHLG